MTDHDVKMIQKALDQAADYVLEWSRDTERNFGPMSHEIYVMNCQIKAAFSRLSEEIGTLAAKPKRQTKLDL